MIHLVTWLPLPYQQALCDKLSESYSRAFVAWFAERADDGFPYKRKANHDFAHYYLSETGYWKLFKALKADAEPVVILGGWSSPLSYKTLLITSLLRVPVFIWTDHPYPRKRSWLMERARKLYIRFLSVLGSGFLACGHPTIDYLVSFGVDAKRIAWFPYWVQIPRDWSLPARCLDKSQASAPLRLLAVGRHVAVKGFDVAIRAVILANEKAGRTIAELIIAGDGPERKRLESLAGSMGCGESISFPGWLEIDEVHSEMNRSDAVIVPSEFEPYGVVVLEAMALGRTVLASAGVVAAQDRDDGNGALLIHPARDFECLADQITFLASDLESLRKASFAVRAIAEKWPLDRAVAILTEILGETKRGSAIIPQPATASFIGKPEHPMVSSDR